MIEQYRSYPGWVVVFVGAMAVAVAGCAGANPAGGSARGRPATVPGGTAVGGSGGAAPGSSGAGGSFDNTSAMPEDRWPTGVTAGEGSAPDQPPDCGGTEVEPTVVKSVVRGNVLVVFDKSLSMNESWGGPDSKWVTSTQAVSDALAPLQDDINAGALFFPNAGWDGCGVTAIDSGSQIDFQPGPAFVSAWNGYLAMHGPSGFTPTGTAVQRADEALSGAQLDGTTAVVVITDGDPNCGTDDAQVNTLVAGWLMNGIKTYVIGLPGADAGTSRLNALAAAGGTDQYLTPNDSAGLQRALSEIVGASVSSSLDSCRITLPETPPNLDDVTLVVVQDGVKQSVARDLGTSGGWSLDADSLEITLEGALCEQAKLGTYSKISVVFGCADLPPLPPPPAPM